MRLCRSLLLGFAVTLFSTHSAFAGYMLFTDRSAFENAANSPLSFEGFNSKASLNSDLNVDVSRYRSSSSLITEGDKALGVFESSTVTISFDNPVFAIGFDINELNSTNLDYLDDAGHSIIDALKITANWDDSTFFGLISDTEISSFSLVGSGSDTALYGLDALSYTAVDVPAPPIAALLILGAFGAITTRRKVTMTTAC